MVLVARGCCAGDDSWVRAFFADRECLIGRATDSSSSDACGDCRFPLDRVVCLVTRLVTASGSSMCAFATARTGAETSSPSMDWFPLPCPAERNDLVSCTVDFLFVEVDFLLAEVAEGGMFGDVFNIMVVLEDYTNRCCIAKIKA